MATSHVFTDITFTSFPPYLCQESFLLQHLEGIHPSLHCSIDRNKCVSGLLSRKNVVLKPIYVAIFEWGRIFFLEKELVSGTFAQEAYGPSLSDSHTSSSRLNSSHIRSKIKVTVWSTSSGQRKHKKLTVVGEVLK